MSSRSDGEEMAEEEPENQVTEALSGCLDFSLTAKERLMLVA